MKNAISGVGFDDTFKTDYYIVSRANGMIGYMIRNFISRETNVLKIYKILTRILKEILSLRIFYSDLGSSVSTWKLEGIQKEIKIIKKLQLQGESGEIRINYCTNLFARWFVFANVPGEQGSIPDRVIPKT